MSHREFVDLVAAMMAAQQEYFRTRSPTAINRSKALEKQVREQIKRELDDRPRLFGGGDDG